MKRVEAITFSDCNSNFLGSTANCIISYINSSPLSSEFRIQQQRREVQALLGKQSEVLRLCFGAVLLKIQSAKISAA